MKWVFLLAVLALAPVLAGVLRSQPRYLVHTCFVLGVSLFVLAPRLWTAPISLAGLAGTGEGHRSLIR